MRTPADERRRQFLLDLAFNAMSAVLWWGLTRLTMVGVGIFMLLSAVSFFMPSVGTPWYQRVARSVLFGGSYAAMWLILTKR